MGAIDWWTTALALASCEPAGRLALRQPGLARRGIRCEDSARSKGIRAADRYSIQTDLAINLEIAQALGISGPDLVVTQAGVLIPGSSWSAPFGASQRSIAI